ncbi:MAG: amino acid ABC transporter substrate-binding protein, partial [Bdellovibrionales bacterium]|nr:amino acid ABC transporter substrate-binding protein [Bdellovibrionales bacterium]
PIAVLYEEQDYALSLAEKLQEILGKEVFKLISYQSDATSIRPQILQARGLKVKGIVLVPVSDATARIALKEMAELKIGVPIFGEVNLCDYPFKPSDYGLSGFCLSAQFEGMEFDNFLKRYTKEVGYPPAYPFYDAMALDLLRYMDKIDRSNKSDVETLRKNILSGFEGSFAYYAFAPSGEVRNSEKYLKKVSY